MQRETDAATTTGDGTEHTDAVRANEVDEAAAGQDETVEGDETDDRPTDEHLADVDDGCGCTEVWEHLSEGRE